MRVLSLAQFLPFALRFDIADDPAVEVADASRAVAEGVLPREPVKIEIDPLPVESRVVGPHHRPPAERSEPVHEVGNPFRRIGIGFVDGARDAGYRQRFRDIILADRPRLEPERRLERGRAHDGPERDHGIQRRRRAVALDINDHVNGAGHEATSLRVLIASPRQRSTHTLRPFSPRICRASAGVATWSPNTSTIFAAFSTRAALLGASLPFSR